MEHIFGDSVAHLNKIVISKTTFALHGFLVIVAMTTAVLTRSLC